MASAAISARIPYIISEIMPAREVHIIGGASGAGKTTLLFQMIDQIEKSQPVFGRKSFPLPSCYVACDRSEASLDRTLERMGLKLNISRISLVENRGLDTIRAVVDAAFKLEPLMKILYIDAMAVLVPQGKISDYKIVADFLAECGNYCVKRDITIVGLHHATKVKEGERFLNPRQRLLGSVAWGGFSETVILIEPKNPEDPTDDSRSVIVLPRNVSQEVYEFNFNSEGRLEELAPKESLKKLLDEKLWPLLIPGQLYRFEAVCGLADSIKLPLAQRTIRRWLDDRQTEGKISKPQRGHYCREIVQ